MAKCGASVGRILQSVKTTQLMDGSYTVVTPMDAMLPPVVTLTLHSLFWEAYSHWSKFCNTFVLEIFPSSDFKRKPAFTVRP